MAEITIDVRGSHTTTLPPERATVHAAVSADGPAPEPVFGTVTGAVTTVRASVEPLHDAERGPVTGFTFDQVRTHSERPWNQEGLRLPLVHHASVSLSVTFSDFDELARWIGLAATVAELHLGHIVWDLAPAHRAAVEREARRSALDDAQVRAQDYADALQLGSVRVLRISDPGVRQGPVPVFKARAFAASAEDSRAGSIELTPQDLEVTAEVEATFAAGS